VSKAFRALAVREAALQRLRLCDSDLRARLIRCQVVNQQNHSPHEKEEEEEHRELFIELLLLLDVAKREAAK